ncbi:MAG: ABC transporter permease, partial [Rhodobacteraceae bacterium]|nr:ABC transporter permease [Paracoccaceae bacterium]
MIRYVSKHGWTIGLIAILALLFAFTKFIQPQFGVSGLDTLARATLPFAFAAAAMSVVVIAGGIDLSVASMMAVAAVTGAVLMDGASDTQAIFVVFGVLILGAVMGAINGSLIVLTRVPDIVVTLAMLFVWEGVALLILLGPGGGAVPWFRGLIVSSFVFDWLPKSFV